MLGFFGNKLKSARKNKRVTLKELSKITGLSASFLSDIEQGRRSSPDFDVILKMQLFLNVELIECAKEEKLKMMRFADGFKHGIYESKVYRRIK